jgi:hypothetical protein
MVKESGEVKLQHAAGRNIHLTVDFLLYIVKSAGGKGSRS